MTLIVSNVGEQAIAEEFLNQPLYLKLYGNDIIPNELSTTETFEEVSGGGYVHKLLNFSDWIISDQGIAICEFQDFQFGGGGVGGGGTVYGYYVVDASGVLRWAERFPTSILPFVPVLDSLIRITPRIQVS